MSASAVLVHLLGGIALLLWGIHTVNAGVLRSFGTSLRWALEAALRNRFQALLAGAAVTTVLQSSTATALMVTSFAASGAVDLAAALAVMLGANIGTTLIVQALSFDISLVYPLLLFIGFLAYSRGGASRVRDIGRILIGLGLMLLSLELLVDAISPMESSAALKTVLGAATDDPIVNLLLAAALAWAAHSSVAALLFIISLGSAGVLEPEAMIAMVLGANLGSSLNPMLEGARGDPLRLRVPVGNFAVRLLGCLLVLPFLHGIPGPLAALGDSPARLAANFHTLFNVAVAVAVLPFLTPLARLLTRLLPERPSPADPSTPLHLDSAALSTPSVALSNAAREVLRIADIAETMLRNSQDLFHVDDPDRVAAISRMDDVIDDLYRAIHRYLGSISHEALSEADTRRLSEILAFAINLEHVGDVIDKNLIELAAKRIRNRMRLSDETLGELDRMHGRLIEHLRLAAAVLMFQDVASARRLVAEKEQFRDIERAATRRHLANMRDSRRTDMDASALQLDIIRDLKRIEAHIAATAYPLLEQSGDLKPSRLAGGG